MHISEKKLLQYAIYSNAIYVFLLFLFRPDGITPQKLIISSFLVFSVVGVFTICVRNKHALKNLSTTARRLFFFLIFWSTIVVIRSFSTSLQDWVTNFGNVYMALAWFTPFLIIVGQKIENWKVVFNSVFFMFQLMLIAFLFLPFHLGGFRLETEWTWLLRPLNFILLIRVNRFNGKYRLLTYIALILYIIVAILTMQRLEFIFLTLVVVFLIINGLKYIKLKREIFIYILIGFIILLWLIFTIGYESISLFANQIIEFQDSRTFLFKELFEDLSVRERIFGRGSLGTYYSDFFYRTRKYYDIVGNTAWKGDLPDRITTEVGYLQMILKGGFLLFIAKASLMLHSAYLALFKANNNFIKRLGLFILIISILSIVSFRPAFTPTFIILWMAIGTVLNKNYREMDDEEINNLIKF